MKIKTVKLGDYFEWNGQIVKCEWINPGSKSIGFTTIQNHACERCGHENKIITGHDHIESSPNFQEGAKSIQTITEK